MNKFVTIFCLLLAISAIYSVGEGTSARMYDGLFPMNGVLATTATNDSTYTSAATTFFTGGGALVATNPTYGLVGGQTTNNTYDATQTADDTFNGGLVAALTTQFRLENVVTNSGSQATFAITSVETNDLGLLQNPGNQIGTVQGLAGADGATASQGRMVIGAASATTFRQNTNMSSGSPGKSNFLGLNVSNRLGAQASPQSSTVVLPIPVRTNVLTQSMAKNCLLGGANVSSLIWCYSFTCATTLTTDLTSGLVGKYSPIGGLHLAANITPVAMSLSAYLTTHFMTTPNPYVMAAVVSGLLTAFGLEEAAVTAATNGINTTTGQAGLTTSFTESDYKTGSVDNVVTQATWLLAVSGMSSWSATARSGATAPWSGVLQNKTYCNAFANNTTYAVPGAYWRSDMVTYSVDCKAVHTYDGMQKSTFATTEITNTAGTALWTNVNGVCNGIMSSTNKTRVNNCCMNSEDMDSFTHCMNFLSAGKLNMTDLGYTALLKSTFDTTTLSTPTAQCNLMLTKGLNWLSVEQMQSWKATCSSSGARTLLSASLVSTATDNALSAAGDLTLAAWETKFGRYYDTWNWSTSDWSTVRNSQLGGLACTNAFSDNVKCQSANTTYVAQNTTQDANWSMLESSAQSALGTACATATLNVAKISRAKNCCLNAKSNAGYDTCVRSAQGADTNPLLTTWENSTGNTGNKNILGLWSGATAEVDNWSAQAKGLYTADYMSQVWGWVAPEKFYSLENLFNSGTMWYEYAVSTLFDFSDTTRTFDEYNEMLTNQPQGFGSNWIGVANCKIQVGLNECSKFNQYNSLFKNSLFNAGELTTLLCPLATEDADHQSYLDLCCERCDIAQAKECVLWAAKANVVNQIPIFKASFENGFAAFETTSAPASKTGLEGDELTLYNCAMKFEEMPLHDMEVIKICLKYGENLTLFQAATDPAAEDSCALVTSTNVASVGAFYTCMMDFEMDASSAGSGSSSGTAASGSSSGTAASGSGTAASGSGSTADCSCYANLLKTFGTSLVMAILLNFLN